MKFRRKFIAYSLIGLMALMHSCADKQPALQLLLTKELDYPSASAIEFYNNRLYVFGDDARNMLMLSLNYSVIDSIAIADSASFRINKNDKHDIESAMIFMDGNKHHLFGVGSMSTSKRFKVVGYDLKAGTVYFTAFFDTSKNLPGIDAVNIEGSCMAEPYLVFANRANLSNTSNHLLFWNKKDSLVTKRFVLPRTKIPAGVSGLYYIKEKDMLLFTASEEETKNTTSDGAIGESYLGWIEAFSGKMNDAELKPDKFLKLTGVDAKFKGQKIESVCVEKLAGNKATLHLAADNDNGKSSLFKILLTLPQEW